MIEVRDTDKVSDLPSGRVPISDTRFVTRDIRLSAALVSLGFALRMDRQPIAVTIDAQTEKRVVDFFHTDGSTHPGLSNVSARDVDLWWRSESGKFSIEGYDDALEAMRTVLKSRSWMLRISRNPKRFSFNGARVDTDSLHMASVLNACNVPVIGYDQQVCRWIFGRGAQLICQLVDAGGKPKEPRPISNDLCIDWMLAALKARDWLMEIIKDPDCIPLIQMDTGKKILQISSQMNKRERNRWIARL